MLSNPKIDAAYVKALALYANLASVTGIDIGSRYTAGVSTGVLAVRIHVVEKLGTDRLQDVDQFPAAIDGVPVDVIQGDYRSSAAVAGLSDAANRRQRFDCLQPGMSVAPRGSDTVGTLGMIVRDCVSGKPAILSNRHVFADSLQSRKGDQILQPASNDGGEVGADVVAELERMILDQHGDAAIALVNDQRPFEARILGLNLAPNAVTDPQIGDVVVKSGVATRVTRGRVDGIGRYFLTYQISGFAQRLGFDGFYIITLDPSNPSNQEISAPGDSGAVWIKDGTAAVVGLHVAGDAAGSQACGEYAIACSATNVFKALNIEPWPAGS